ncbi:hypothetical protein [Pseudomonas marginalis]|uniref:Uncharacterized protein n=1 Tax=Pseudomonas marginalis TaxID=298 RepID=A0A9X9FWQ5_PSEMA|nr:hypothetical protein [Pseudomonas marginalis]TWR58048.1 hypothetical protein FIV41_17575 [Pseudomonas marginalis]SEC88897.1 hypothetical protein SAMN04490193_3932 [Pseudomonas marginalis]
MEPNEVIDALAVQVESAKSRGLKDVSIESLEMYMVALRERVEKLSPLTEANNEFQRQANDHAFQDRQAMFRTVIDSGQAALKASLLVGGGAAAALLAFASSAWKSLKPEGLELLGLTIFVLAIGVLLVVLASGATYLSQGLYHDGLGKPHNCKEDRAGDILRYISLTLVVSSYGLYALACWFIYKMMGSFSIVGFIPVG